MSEPAALGELAALAAEAPLPLRAAVGLCGGVLWLAGARVYQGALLGSAFTLGAIGGASALAWAAAWVPQLTEPLVLGLGSLATGVALVGVASLAHRVALLAVGAVVGLAGGAALGPWLLAVAPWIPPVVGAALGAALFPLLFPLVLRIATPLVGAVCIAWAVQRPDHVGLLAGLWACGVAVQLGMIRRPGSVESGDPAR